MSAANPDPAFAPVLRGWAWLDLVVTGVLAIPPLAPLFIALVFALDGALGGSAEPTPYDATQRFFVSLAGTLGVLWAWARIRMPLAPLGWADTIGRVWVGALLVYFIVFEGGPRSLCLFVSTELAGAVHQFAVLRRASDANPAPGLTSEAPGA